MRFKITSVIFFLSCIFVGYVLIYQIINFPNDVQSQSNLKKEQVELLEKRLQRLEKDISTNHETIKEIKKLIKSLGSSYIDDVLLEPPQYQEAKPPNKLHRKPIVSSTALLKHREINEGSVDFPIFNSSLAYIQQDDCIFSQTPPSTVDYQMKDIYDILPFDNIDGGAWKQGWDIEYNENQWSPQNKLKVFVMPHSHNDPGWIKTFDAYFKDQTKQILDNMVVKLSGDHRRKFIWAEISYFATWWELQSSETRDKVKRLLERGQLEIVSGGWVMPDEATTHFESLVSQLVTGHEWMRVNLGVKPINGWSIDPFGMSPTMAYLLKRSGFQNMLIQRTHYSLKKHLAREKSLEFRWRQIWDNNKSTDILCHMMPFYSYDIPHTCGPDPKVCCQFDFRRLPRSGITCPWRVQPQPITYANVKERAQLLLDQYRKKSQLYRTNVLLIPLGDDFRYNKADEWDLQYGNYQQLFDYMNSRADLNVQAQFGTLSDYFRTLRMESGQMAADDTTFFPSLSGDFFTYADRDDHYWSGYFTTRPFYKRMNRILQSYLKTADIFYSLLLEKVSYAYGDEQDELMSFLLKALNQARKDHGLFQHHDGMTGTSKDHVVQDYAHRMTGAIRACQHVIQHAAHSLLSDDQKPDSHALYFSLDEKFPEQKSMAAKTIIELKKDVESKIFFLNPELHRRNQLVTVRVNLRYVQVHDRAGIPVLCQINPVYAITTEALSDQFDVIFIVSLDALSLTEFSLKGMDESSFDKSFTTFGKIRANSIKVIHPSGWENQEMIKSENNKPFVLECGQLVANFSSNGFLQNLKKFGMDIDLGIRFVTYGSRGSGAYLFLPNGKASEISILNPTIIIIEGIFQTSLTFYTDILRHQVKLKNSPGADGLGLEIDNYVDIKRKRDYELVMKISTKMIENGRTFYTDLNGFQVIKRSYYPKIPIQGNVYPMTTQIFIEDQNYRLSLLSAQPLGVGAMHEGEMEVFLDRQLTLDDNRGLGQGIQDNVLTLNRFTLLFENKVVEKESSQYDESPAGFPSLLSHSVLNLLLHPTHHLHPTGLQLTDGKKITYQSHWSLGGDLPSDIDMVSLQVQVEDVDENPSKNVALLLHRRAFSCGIENRGVVGHTNNGKVRLSDLFPASFNDDVKQISVSLMYEGIDMNKAYTLSLKPMELYSFRLSISGRK